jgi:hypothetical protein
MKKIEMNDSSRRRRPSASETIKLVSQLAQPNTPWQ